MKLIALLLGAVVATEWIVIGETNRELRDTKRKLQQAELWTASLERVRRG